MTSEEGTMKDDIKLPQRKMRPITILVSNGAQPALQSFVGRWLAQCIYRPTGARYSLAETHDGAFVAIAKYDQSEAVKAKWFEDAAAVRASDLQESLRRAAVERIERSDNYERSS
jgi:hypothetical protein